MQRMYHVSSTPNDHDDDGGGNVDDDDNAKLSLSSKLSFKRELKAMQRMYHVSCTSQMIMTMVIMIMQNYQKRSGSKMQQMYVFYPVQYKMTRCTTR